jgi:hypothetical protein
VQAIRGSLVDDLDDLVEVRRVGLARVDVHQRQQLLGAGIGDPR